MAKISKKVLDYLDKVEGDAAKFKEILSNLESNNNTPDFMIKSLCDYVNINADKISNDFKFLAPYGKYEKLLESKEDISNFVKLECSKQDNWKLHSIYSQDSKNLLKLIFDCTAADSNLRGYVIVSNDGKIKHLFANYNDD